MYNPNTYGMSDLARRRAFEHRHVSASIEPLGNPRRDNAWGLTLWIVAGAVSLAAITIGLLGMAGAF